VEMFSGDERRILISEGGVFGFSSPSLFGLPSAGYYRESSPPFHQ